MNNRSGKVGEDYAAALLEQKGFLVTARNYHSRWGEIDIIARDDQYILFVEVKTRAENAMGHPLEAVTPMKQQKLIKTALQYLSAHPELAELQPRFDVAGLITRRTGMQIKEVIYIPNAFEGDLL